MLFQKAVKVIYIIEIPEEDIMDYDIDYNDLVVEYGEDE